MEAFARLLQQLRRECEISLGRFNRYVAEVGRKVWQQMLDVFSRAIPGNQTMGGARVTNVVKTRLRVWSTGAADTGRGAQSAKVLQDIFVIEAVTGASTEEAGVLTCGQWQTLASLRVVNQCAREPRASRHKPRFTATPRAA